MANAVDHSTKVLRLFVAASVMLWSLSLILPVAHMLGTRFRGWDVLWMGAAGPIVDPQGWTKSGGWAISLPWLANAAWFTAMVQTLTGRRAIRGLGLAAFVLALTSFLTFRPNPSDAGFWVWLAALFLCAALDLTPRSRRRSGS